MSLVKPLADILLTWSSCLTGKFFTSWFYWRKSMILSLNMFLSSSEVVLVSPMQSNRKFSSDTVNLRSVLSFKCLFVSSYEILMRLPGWHSTKRRGRGSFYLCKADWSSSSGLDKRSTLLFRLSLLWLLLVISKLRRLSFVTETCCLMSSRKSFCLSRTRLLNWATSCSSSSNSWGFYYRRCITFQSYSCSGLPYCSYSY